MSKVGFLVLPSGIELHGASFGRHAGPLYPKTHTISCGNLFALRLALRNQLALVEGS